MPPLPLDAPACPPDAFALDPAVVHLNHGSFGACPRAVLAEQTRLRARIEAATMRYFVRDWQADLDAARARVAAFVGADPDGLVFVPNTTTGVSTVLGSLALAPGDELLCTDHTYRACRNALDRIAARAGARVVVARLPWPVPDAAAVTAAIAAAATPRTRLALIDHVTSATALVVDVAGLCRALAARGVDVLVDGAHAPGQVDLDVGALAAAGCTYYVANGHKWLCGPKGGALLWTRADRRAGLRPLVTSHGASPEYGPANRLWAELDWPGTHDPTPYLALPFAIDHVGGLGGGWPAVRARNHALAVAGRALLADRLGATRTLVPDAQLGAMAVVPVELPAGARPIEVERRLLDAGWEAPVVPAPDGGALVRISAHLYNHLGELEGLAVALSALGVRGA